MGKIGTTESPYNMSASIVKDKRFKKTKKLIDFYRGMAADFKSGGYRVKFGILVPFFNAENSFHVKTSYLPDFS